MGFDFRIAWRNLRRRAGHSIAHVAGLTVGLACFFLILLFVSDEQAYDQFHEHKDRLFQVGTDAFRGEDEHHYARASRAAAEFIRDRFPEIEAQTQLAPYNPSVKQDGRYFNQNPLYFAEPDFADLFSFRVVSGDLKEALSTPDAIAITEKMRSRYFGHEDALGRTLVLNDSVVVTVKAVLANPPRHSHIQFDGLVSWITQQDWPFLAPGDWLFLNQFLYLKARPGVDAARLDSLLSPLAMQEFSEQLAGSGITVRLQTTPVSTLYLRSTRTADIGPKGDADYVRLFLSIGVLILILAIINYVNLSTARATERAREVGIRKVSGSLRGALVGQFLGESVLMGTLAGTAAGLLTWWLLPHFNQISQKQLVGADLFDPGFLLLAVGVTLAVGLVAGLYPALVLSRFQPIEVLRGRFSASSKGIGLRRVLVVAQFTASIALVAYSLVMYAQIRHMRDQPLGFRMAHQIVVNGSGVVKSIFIPRLDAFVADLRAQSGVRSVSYSSSVPGKGAPFYNIYPENAAGEANTRDSYLVAVDDQFDDQFDLEMVAGTFFDAAYPAADSGWVINEKLMEIIGWASPQEALGKRISVGDDTGVVVGVMKDFHYYSLKNPLPPLLLQREKPWTNFVTVSFESGPPQRQLEIVQAAWDRHFPEFPHVAGYLDDEFALQYQNDQLLLRLFLLFTVVAVCIAAFGLFGLVSYAATLRVREIGIRKIFGAGGWHLAWRLGAETTVLIGIAFVLAVPISWRAASSWMDGFPYPAGVDPLLFAWAALLTAGITLVATGWVMYRAVTRNPADVLRYE